MGSASCCLCCPLTYSFVNNSDNFKPLWNRNQSSSLVSPEGIELFPQNQVIKPFQCVISLYVLILLSRFFIFRRYSRSCLFSLCDNEEADVVLCALIDSVRQALTSSTNNPLAYSIQPTLVQTLLQYQLR